jgi:hypothetical protein
VQLQSVDFRAQAEVVHKPTEHVNVSALPQISRSIVREWWSRVGAAPTDLANQQPYLSSAASSSIFISIVHFRGHPSLILLRQTPKTTTILELFQIFPN